MIHLILGDNTFEVKQALEKRIAVYTTEIQHFDGEEQSIAGLADMLLGQSLFGGKKVVVLSRASANSQIWAALPDWLAKVDDDSEIMVVEPGVDKRTATYKWLKKHAEVEEYLAWGERDTPKAEAWAVSHAKELGKPLDKKVARALVARTGVDQWRIHHALEKLTLLDEIIEADIENIVEQNPSENIFSLFETALSGDVKALHAKIETLSLVEDAYKVMGLLASQAFQLAVLVSTDKPSAEVAKDLGAHPFVLGKLSRHAKHLGRPGARHVVQTLATADMRLKSTDAKPWAVIEQALMEITKK